MCLCECVCVCVCVRACVRACMCAISVLRYSIIVYILLMAEVCNTYCFILVL